MSGRKALLRAYKERKVEAGIYAVRCSSTNEVWIGATPDLATRQSGVWFSLRQGSHREPALQSAWNAHGAEAFVFEPVEIVDAEGLDRFGRDSRLKERRKHWIEALNARGLQ
ncbi:GIY-YIG nuclease family protein [Caulobacter sp.]|uniref:GIY-YIG nuclease family protein n=1 Tax=Caulobacter sp. TaxID=78 RepID=UPI002B4A3902|nr:GIY-YIG nuclease family protein [Caulobacter sp.]HJV42320.1 GIY-YIG nuclease family protein [Caulobacter sp.]